MVAPVYKGSGAVVGRFLIFHSFIIQFSIFEHYCKAKMIKRRHHFHHCYLTKKLKGHCSFFECIIYIIQNHNLNQIVDITNNRTLGQPHINDLKFKTACFISWISSLGLCVMFSTNSISAQICAHHNPSWINSDKSRVCNNWFHFILIKLFPEAHLYSGFKILSGTPIQNIIWIYRRDLCQHTRYEECKPSIAHYQIIKYNRVEASKNLC